MTTEVLSTLKISNQAYADVIQQIKAVIDKLKILNLEIIHTVIGELNGDFFIGFHNLINLDLSNCSIYTFKNGVFNILIQLQSLNLSDNTITCITDNLFETNSKLKTIILKNNLLESINNLAFWKFEYLETLDLSHNFISKLDNNCLNSSTIKYLYLNNNKIGHIQPKVLHNLPNLTYLALNNNKIKTLEQHVFHGLTKLEFLDLDNNNIPTISHNCFYKLEELQKIHLRNNRLTQVIDELIFFRNPKLIEIDLSENEINGIEKKSFSNCTDLRYLNLKVCGHFEPNSIKHLKALTYFELNYKSVKESWDTRIYWTALHSKTELTVLKLIFQKIDFLALCTFSHFVNLEYIHIECLEPNENVRDIRLNRCFNNMSKLKTLNLVKLNGFKVSNCFLKTQKMRNLSLIGMKNEEFNDLFYHLDWLIYLNLSFCEIKFINSHSFKYLSILRTLIFEHSKLTKIDSFFVTFNSELRILNCANCRIESIEDFSFKNLRNLETLDLRHNFLKRFTDNTFAGLNKQTCNILL